MDEMTMEWMLPVNEMLKDEVTKLDSNILPPEFKGDAQEKQIVQDSLMKLIDMLGEWSAAAQGLNRVITTANKLMKSPTNTLYLLKDPKGRDGDGEVIGMLKMGHKHLFLFNQNDKVCEVEPLCVLDFFVLANRQRHGFGKKLFDHMLKDMGITAQELAVDGPSEKMEQFLARNYGITRLMRQNNNFAVAPEFFLKMHELSKCSRQILEDNKKCAKLEPLSSKRMTAVATASTPAVGRFTAPKPQSDIATVIHGDGGAVPVEGTGSELPDQLLPSIEALHVSALGPEEHRPLERPSSLPVEPVHAEPLPAPPPPAPAGAPAPAGVPAPAADTAPSAPPAEAPAPATGRFASSTGANIMAAGRPSQPSGWRTPTTGGRTPTSGGRTPTSGGRTPNSGNRTPASGNRHSSGGARNSGGGRLSSGGSRHSSGGSRHAPPRMRTLATRNPAAGGAVLNGVCPTAVHEEPVMNGVVIPAAVMQPAPVVRPGEPAPVDGIPEVSAAGIVTTPSNNARRDSQLTDRGFFDVKFYHNKLW